MKQKNATLITAWKIIWRENKDYLQTNQLNSEERNNLGDLLR